jgi:hypothetical protein
VNQAEVPLGDQLVQRNAVAAILNRSGHHVAKVRLDQTASGSFVLVLNPSDGEAHFGFTIQSFGVFDAVKLGLRRGSAGA